MRNTGNFADQWNDTCRVCGIDLPIDAPSHQKYCSVECRRTAQEEADLKRRPAYNARRRQARLDAKRDRPPCPECGAPIPPEASTLRKYCSTACEARFNNRAKAARERAVRLALREAKRAARKGNV